MTCAVHCIPPGFWNRIPRTGTFPRKTKFIQEFIQDFFIAPLKLHCYSEATESYRNPLLLSLRCWVFYEHKYAGHKDSTKGSDEACHIQSITNKLPWNLMNVRSLSPVEVPNEVVLNESQIIRSIYNAVVTCKKKEIFTRFFSTKQPDPELWPV